MEHDQNKQLLVAMKHAVDDVLLVQHQHDTHCLCKRSQAESWARPRRDTIWMDWKAQVRRTKKYERRVRKVFKDAKSIFNANYREQQGGIFGALGQMLDNLNPLAAAATARLRKAPLNQQEWITIVEGATAHIANDLDDALLVNVTDEIRSRVTEVNQVMASVQGRREFSRNVQIPVATMEFFQQYELQLSQSTKSRVDDRLHGIIRDGLAQGWSNQRIRDEIVAHFDTLTRKHAFMIARTETIRASAEGSKIGYMANGVKMVQVLPALDACPICVEIARRNPYRVDDPRAYAPFHPNCRCSIVPIIDGIGFYDPNDYPEVFLSETGVPTFVSANPDGTARARTKAKAERALLVTLSDGTQMRTHEGFAYHASTHATMEAIREQGLLPEQSVHDQTKRLYLAPHPSIASAASAEHATTVLYRIPNDRVQRAKPQPDPHLPHGISMFITRRILPTYIEVWSESRAKWVPLKGWDGQ